MASPRTWQELHGRMRRLWTEHVLWTRQVIVSALAGLPDLEAAKWRLLVNQDQLGAAIVPFYGVAAGQRLAALLREHIAIALKLVVAMKTGQAAETERQRASWYRNAADIATFLNQANRALPVGVVLPMLREHLKLTQREAAFRIQGRWADDVANFDVILSNALHMADALTSGIMSQVVPQLAGPSFSGSLQGARRVPPSGGGQACSAL